jgi:hypothetical protein
VEQISVNPLMSTRVTGSNFFGNRLGAQSAVTRGSIKTPQNNQQTIVENDHESDMEVDDFSCSGSDMSETENFKTNFEENAKPKKFDFVERVGANGNLSSNSD